MGKIKLCIVGKGKLANSLYKGLKEEFSIYRWDEYSKIENEKIIVLHSGSGRQFSECLDYCNRTNSIFIELSTGENIDRYNIKCPLILCPNSAMPILKMMSILKSNGNKFSQYKIRIIESHQESKKTIAGTAYEIAKAFNLKIDDIESIRNTNDQVSIGIPNEYLNLHAFHKIVIEDEGCEIIIQLKILGHVAYVNGIKALIEVLKSKKMENMVYNVSNLIEANVS